MVSMKQTQIQERSGRMIQKRSASNDRLVRWIDGLMDSMKQTQIQERSGRMIQKQSASNDRIDRWIL
jgi:hypothetical protein